MDVTMIATVGAITVISYLVGMACKAIDSVQDKYIPVIVINTIFKLQLFEKKLINVEIIIINYFFYYLFIFSK